VYYNTTLYTAIAHIVWVQQYQEVHICWSSYIIS